MPRNRKNFPRLLTHVLQAVADLREPQGSTIRKILDQVQTAINISNIRPRPRNVVMQVRRAIKHGIDNGVLKQRAGKIQLTLGSSEGNGRRPKAVSCTVKPSRRSRRLSNKKPRFALGESTSNFSGFTFSDYSLPRLRKRNAAGRFDVSDKIMESRRRRKVKKGRRRSRRRAKKRRRQVTPMPVDVDEENTVSDQNVEHRSHHQFDYNQDKVESNHSVGEREERHEDPGHECDNPDCLCNLKQEPDDVDESPFNNDYM